MKVAILISGMPRNYEQGFPSHLKYLIEPFDEVDIFIHTWVNPELVGTSFFNEGGNKVTKDLESDYMNRIVELYNPKSITFEHITPNFPMSDAHHEKMFPNVRLYAHWSMFYGMYRAWKLMEDYHANDEMTEYDLVFRLRFDWEIYSLPLGDVFPNTIYAPDDGPHKLSFNDQFAYGQHTAMKKYMTTYEDLFEINEEVYGIVGETVVFQRMLDTDTNIVVQPIKYRIIREG